ncbi:MAG TPA: hypothetical protein VFI61_00105 [Patescibacteria group bacterium]|nr:hypothetical protein [Patescibacteria group bacterium]
MSDEWKKLVDDKIEREHQQEVTKKQKAENKVAWMYRLEYAIRFWLLQHIFFCHICHTHATKPAKQEIDVGDYKAPDVIDDWSQPGDLEQCVKCCKWTCEEHIHKGICQKCAIRLKRPWLLRWL